MKTLRETATNDISQKRNNAGSMFGEGELNIFSTQSRESPEDIRGRSNLFAMTQISTPDNLGGTLKVSPTKRKLDQPGKTSPRISLDAPSGSSVRLSRPFGSVVESSDIAGGERQTRSDDEHGRLPRFGEGSDVSEPEPFDGPPTVNTSKIRFNISWCNIVC